MLIGWFFDFEGYRFWVFRFGIFLEWVELELSLRYELVKGFGIFVNCRGVFFMVYIFFFLVSVFLECFV